MKKNSKKLIIFLLLCFFNSFFSYSQSYKPWDYRSTGLRFYGKMGVGFTVGTHQSTMHLITDLHLDYTTDQDEIGVSKLGLPVFDKKHAHRWGLNFNFVISRNLKLYNRSLPEREHPSWTFQNTLAMKYGWSKRSEEYRMGLVELNDDFFKDTRFQVIYSVKAFYNTGYFRKLSNVVGQAELNYGKMNEGWDFNASWGNDLFLLGDLQSLKRDHGITNVFNLGISTRLDDKHVFDNGRLSFDYENMIVTDRSKGLGLQTPEVRMGEYEVLGTESAFHNYHWFSFGFEHDYLEARARVGKDDLKAGRNLQRFAHQSVLHQTVKKRLKFLRWFKGSVSPLFPWEEQDEFYEYPELIDQLIIIGSLPFKKHIK